MSLWSTNYSLFSMMYGLNHCNSSSRCHATPGQFLEISCFPCVFCTLSCLYKKKKDDTANTSSCRRNGNTVNTVTATIPGISIPNICSWFPRLSRLQRLFEEAAFHVRGAGLKCMRCMRFEPHAVVTVVHHWSTDYRTGLNILKKFN